MINNMNMHMDHMVVWVEDLDGTARFLRDIVGFRQHSMDIGCSDDDPTTGGMAGLFFDGNGVWLELIKPTTPGPGMDILNQVGAGTLVEINFQPQDYDGVLREMKERGIQMLNMDGSPLGDDGGLIKEGVGLGDDIEHTGQRIAYWPIEATRGSSVEIFEVIPNDQGGLINIRDSLWENESDSEEIWIDHIAVWVKDLEATASFYTDVLGLKRYAKEIDNSNNQANEKIGAFKACFIDCGGVWLELVQPVGPGALMETLNEKGDGYLGEICVCVKDLDAYNKKMEAKGIQMVNIDGSPLDDKNCILEPHGEKMAYFPKDVSCGMTIEIIQPGPKETSCLPPRSYPPSWS
ncbi:hypothetical protein HBA55_21835 [Pseudomaricurvus alkylphenolicus]|uniref:VOC family protein n=1 Tax=Pseudomaricurvus alkylphenolicus TaxID=1306991 RepID=UPI0014200C6B|nr:VOC family protein [Pseudomaricurvus alkylphenolicus]NIB42263.1 hypothetical protein [Pseudomaricurvus alkylphenolicus]